VTERARPHLCIEKPVGAPSADTDRRLGEPPMLEPATFVTGETLHVDGGETAGR
jgi:hypothetical protein